ncbi:flagellar basal body rod C-terminal domain-containing protein [Desulfurispira natronophila]|uniref:Flagellar basal-body rod protein FlgC n=1 Tax=Desulfurispira natronophila TaxID=682562 RepID=A0A7W8DFZ5_9BACT|nr:flagellar basal body rod C-terminal domain-containing protein [Desulfurispira natronophila]MBB5020850.1 flagellar basal-body rod protein FlgC [Desulfurispira natronophila]
MIDAFYNAASALSAYGQRQSASAHNVANVNTNEFKSQRVDLAEKPTGGVTPTGVTTDTSPGAIRPSEFPEDKVVFSNDAMALAGHVESSNTDLAREMVNSTVNSYSFSANTGVVRTQDDMVGTILDIVS